MGRVYLDYDGKKWNRVEKSDFWMDEALLKMLDNLKMIQKKQWDGVFIVDGQERSGKSILGMICGWYLSNTKLSINNFALGLHDVAKKIAELPDESVLIMDEGSTMLSAKKSSSAMQKNLMEILDVVGQKKLFFIIILPCFFDLNKTIAVRRSKFLLHVYPDEKYNRGRYAFWGEKTKAKLYHFGKKNFDSYAFPHAEFLGEYPEFHTPWYEDYLNKVKRETLNKVLKNAGDKSMIDYRGYNLKVKWAGRLKMFHPELTLKQLGEIFEEPPTTISDWVNVYRRRLEEEKALKDMDLIGQSSDETASLTAISIPLYTKVSHGIPEVKQ